MRLTFSIMYVMCCLCLWESCIRLGVHVPPPRKLTDVTALCEDLDHISKFSESKGVLEGLSDTNPPEICPRVST